MAIRVPAERIQAARDGGPGQIEALLEAVWPDVYRLAYAILDERQGAEDAAQESCIILYRIIASLRNPAAFNVWLYRIVVREASEIKRRRSRVERTEQPLPQEQTAALDVWRALSALPPNLREVVVLRYFEDLSCREIASALQIPDGTVRFRLMVAKHRLRPLLSDDSQEAPKTARKVGSNAI